MSFLEQKEMDIRQYQEADELAVIALWNNVLRGLQQRFTIGAAEAVRIGSCATARGETGVCETLLIPRERRQTGAWM